MSREVDMEHPENWTEDEVQYLRDRGQLPDDYQESEAEDEGYASMKKRELRSLVDSRGLDVDAEASKADLIAALEEDDGSK